VTLSLGSTVRRARLFLVAPAMALTKPNLGVRACSVQRVYAQQPDAEVV
jgi:hypothetical protein